MLTVFTYVTTTGQLLFECSRYDMVVGPSFNFGVVGLLFYEICCALCVSGGEIEIDLVSMFCESTSSVDYSQPMKKRRTNFMYHFMRKYQYLDYAIYSVYRCKVFKTLLRYRFSLVKGIVHQCWIQKKHISWKVHLDKTTLTRNNREKWCSNMIYVI